MDHIIAATTAVAIKGENIEKSKSFGKLILQPRNGQAKLRSWLLDNGFSIVNESLVRENKYICEVITVVPYVSEDAVSYSLDNEIDDPMCFEVPPWILTAGELAAPFIQNKINIEEYALNGILKADVIDKDREKVTRARIDYLQNLLGGI